jgi:hypothetical protein
MVDKFLVARSRSWEWEEKYGKTYRIWAASIPEVYVCPIYLLQMIADSLILESPV